VCARRWRSLGVAAAVGLLAACGATPEEAPALDALGDEAVTIGSFDFPESELLGELYGAALEDAGYEVRLELGLGPRELLTPALSEGLVELVPEYLGTALQFVSLGQALSTPDTERSRLALVRVLADGPLRALDPAPAQDANVFVVTAETAERAGLVEVSDLHGVAPDLRFAGPPECRTRPLCLGGLEQVYGLRFGTFLPLDAGGPLTRQALEEGHADVGLLFSTDPAIDGEHFVALEDDRSLQPAENVTPIVRADALERWGDEFVAVLDGVSADLTTEVLRGLNGEVAAGRSAGAVAREWLDGR
jgi:osmoprotectant transport system substrate-binding protein